MIEKADRNRCACPADLYLRITFSRTLVGWCEFSARLFNPLCWRCSTPDMIQSLRNAVALQLIRVDHPRDVPQTLQQLKEEPLRRLLVPTTLHQDVKHIAILIHGSPQVVIPAIDLEEHLIHVPLALRAGDGSGAVH